MGAEHPERVTEQCRDLGRCQERDAVAQQATGHFRAGHRHPAHHRSGITACIRTPVIRSPTVILAGRSGRHNTD